MLVTVSDRKIGVSGNGTTIDYYTADVISANDYYPFGMTMVGRNYSRDDYRYGFNGKENDNETNWQDYGMRPYDPRVARLISVDPLKDEFPWFTPYQFAGNTPIQAVDFLGLQPKGCHWNSAYGRLHNFTVSHVPSMYDNQAWQISINGGPQRLMNVYAVQDVDNKTYLIYETATGTKQSWYYEYDKDGYKGDVNSFEWYTPPNPADALTAMTVGPLVAVPALFSSSALTGFLLKEAAEEGFERITGIPVVTNPLDLIQKAFKKGVYKGSAKGLTEWERKRAAEYLSDGNKLERIEEGADKTADYLLNGKKIEFKALTGDKLNINSGVTHLKDATKKPGVKILDLDIRTPGGTLRDAKDIYNRFKGTDRGKAFTGEVRIATKDGLITF